MVTKHDILILTGAVKKPARNTVSILTGRMKTQFSYLRSSVLPLRNKTIFAVDTAANFIPSLSKIVSSVSEM